jgi:hypothetical protein
MTLSVQFRRQFAHALARPTQRRLRVSTRHRLDQPLQIFIQAEILRHRLLAPPSNPSDAPWADACFLLKLLDTQTDRLAGEPSGSRHKGDSSTPYEQCLCSGEQSSRPLIEFLGQQVKSLLDSFFSFIHTSHFTTRSSPFTTFIF